ncbi:MAG: ribonuclease J, partial [Dehalococcoidales bacterium]|nr:ribonuclease J [Dehalococcoidales bacterium]
KLVGHPDIVSRGFVDTNEAKDMLEESCNLVAENKDHGGKHTTEWGFADNKVRTALSNFYYDKTKRRPMILPVMVKV